MSEYIPQGLLQISAGLGYALGPTLGGLLYQVCMHAWVTITNLRPMQNFGATVGRVQAAVPFCWCVGECLHPSLCPAGEGKQ